MNIDLSQFKPIPETLAHKAGHARKYNFPAITLGNTQARLNAAATEILANRRYFQLKINGSLLLLAFSQPGIRPESSSLQLSFRGKGSSATITFARIGRYLESLKPDGLSFDFGKNNYDYKLEIIDGNNFVIDLRKCISKTARVHRGADMWTVVNQSGGRL